MVRKPAVAGQFYPGNEKQLRSQLQEMIGGSVEKEKVLGVISPHAGYMYSGAVAGRLFSAVAVPQTVVILGPNHQGVGASVALYPDGEWLTPLGSVAINSRLSGLIQEHAPLVVQNDTAHVFEHSLEVQVPFLQAVAPGVTIVPLCLGFGNYAACVTLGEGIARAIRDYGDEVLIIASSDMTHYESADAAREKDDLAIKQVLALNPEGLLRVCRDRGITMCGVVPATVMLVAARELGGTRAKLLSYATSGDVTGDKRQVVAYAAMSVC